MNGNNRTPIADAGADVTITLPDRSITLPGNAIDVDGTITQYNWYKMSGPAVASVATNQPQLALNNLLAGEYGGLL